MGIQGCQQKEERQPGELNVCNIIVEDSLIWDPLISFPIRLILILHYTSAFRSVTDFGREG